MDNVLTADNALDLVMKDVLGSQPWTAIYKASLWENIRFPIGRTYEDLAIAPLIYIKNIKPVSIINEPLYIYNCHPNNTSQTPSPNKNFDIFLAFYERWELSRKLKMASEKDCFYKAYMTALGTYNYYLRVNRNIDPKKLDIAFKFLNDHKKAILTSNLNTRYDKTLLNLYFFNKPLYTLLIRLLNKIINR